MNVFIVWKGFPCVLNGARNASELLREAMPVPDQQDQVWSLDFIHDQLLEGRRFKTRLIIEAWKKEYNGERPHSSLKGLTPNEFAAMKRATTLTTYNPNSVRFSVVQ